MEASTSPRAGRRIRGGPGAGTGTGADAGRGAGLASALALPLVLVLALGVSGCGALGGSMGAPPTSEAGLTWITVPPPEGWNDALLQGATVVESGGCLALEVPGGSEELIHPIFSSADRFPEGLEVGDVVSLGGSEGDLAALRETEVLIPEECADATRVWFAAPEH